MPGTKDLISFSEAQMLIFSLEPWISPTKVMDMPNFGSANHFLKVSSVFLFCYTEVETLKSLSILSNSEYFQCLELQG